jgi:hypothetical protein
MLSFVCRARERVSRLMNSVAVLPSPHFFSSLSSPLSFFFSLLLPSPFLSSCWQCAASIEPLFITQLLDTSRGAYLGEAASSHLFPPLFFLKCPFSFCVNSSALFLHTSGNVRYRLYHFSAPRCSWPVFYITSCRPRHYPILSPPTFHHCQVPCPPLFSSLSHFRYTSGDVRYRLYHFSAPRCS